MATIDGTTGNDSLLGSIGNDTITPGNGNDAIDGGGGTDAVTFSGVRANYSISQTFAGFLVTDTVGGTGIKTISNISSLQFSDTYANLNVAIDARTISTTQLNSLTELYVAYFNRVPDASGLDYWIKALAGGTTLDQIGSSFYEAAISPAYSSLTGYSSTMTNADFVKIIYANVLGRTATHLPPPQADVDYWAGNLANGQATRASLISTMLSAAHGYAGDPTWGSVATLLDNKVSVGTYHAVTSGIDYSNPTTAYTTCSNIAAQITPTDTAAAISLIGISTQTDYQSPPMPG